MSKLFIPWYIGCMSRLYIPVVHWLHVEIIQYILVVHGFHVPIIYTGSTLVACPHYIIQVAHYWLHVQIIYIGSALVACPDDLNL